MSQEELNNSQLLSYVDTLSKSFVIRRDISKKSLDTMRKLFVDRDFSQCILKVKLYFKLGMTLRICYPREKKDFSYFFREGGDFFNAFKPYFASPPERKKAPAQIEIPCFLPRFGTAEFNELKINMKVRDVLKVQSFETFVSVISHEMAHLILCSTGNKLRESEIATDLITMILGFTKIMKKGRKSNIGRFCYLNDEQFQIAYREIKKRQRRAEFLNIPKFFVGKKV